MTDRDYIKRDSSARWDAYAAYMAGLTNTASTGNVGLSDETAVMSVNRKGYSDVDSLAASGDVSTMKASGVIRDVMERTRVIDTPRGPMAEVTIGGTQALLPLGVLVQFLHQIQIPVVKFDKEAIKRNNEANEAADIKKGEQRHNLVLEYFKSLPRVFVGMLSNIADSDAFANLGYWFRERVNNNIMPFLRAATWVANKAAVAVGKGIARVANAAADTAESFVAGPLSRAVDWCKNQLSRLRFW